jgi:hypothetical protein
MSDTATNLTGGSHGTKIIGVLMTVLGTVAGVNPAAVPPSWVPYILGAGGLLTVLRGVINTRNEKKE